ncbi:MAG: hypothetical protein JST80_03495 [Bdellovibrionales bacterium]|nr:hypothetical protein [Bdellovibrionales bacterium]
MTGSIKDQNKNVSLIVPPRFPKLWRLTLDEVIPAFVKERFSPQEKWKNKPFSQEDVAFFSKGLLELSDFFTEEREGAKLPNYFTTAKFRSSYFLYFLALQGAKFLTLFDRYPLAIDAALEHARKSGVLRVVDVGAGPGTASVAFFIHVFERLATEMNEKGRVPFKIELHWIDHNKAILDDGKIFFERLLGELGELHPHLEADVNLTTDPRAWWQHPRDFNYEASIVLFGNVLNESSRDPRAFQQGLAPFLRNPRGAGILMIEPAFKSASQRLSQIRNEWLSVREFQPSPIWGPCLHSGLCPLSDGRDWCHFSVPAELPGEFFRKFSIKLGSVREWLKFSFLWVGAEDSKSVILPRQKGIARIVSNAMKTNFGNSNQVCLPEKISFVPAIESRKHALYRGSVIDWPPRKKRKTGVKPRFKGNHR